MFQRYKQQNLKYVEVPTITGTAVIETNEKCQILKINGKDFLYMIDHKGEYFVKANLWHGNDYYPFALLMLLISKKLVIPKEHYHLVEHFYLDSNPQNLHISNIGYRFLRPIEHEDYKGYFRIPFFSRYVISEQGVVFEVELEQVVQPLKYAPGKGNLKKKIKGGYKILSMESDGGKTIIGAHRLMGLTFLPYPNNVDKLVVNHKNGLPGDDWVENLEWVTRSDNNIHAVQNGLRSQNVICYCKNIYTGEELTFASYSLCARHFNMKPSTITMRANSPNQVLYEGGWLFKRDIDTPWRVPENPEQELKSQSTPTKVYSRNVFTGEVREHNSIAQCGIDLKFKSPHAVQSQIKKGIKRPYYGYNFRTEFDKTPWQEFSDRELAVFKENPSNNARGVIAENDAGEELFFTNINKATQHFKHILGSKNDVIKAIARNRNVDGYKLRYL